MTRNGMTFFRSCLTMVNPTRFTLGRTVRDVTFLWCVVGVMMMFSFQCTTAAQSVNSSPSTPVAAEEHVCSDIDIRNNVGQFFKLENCTVIEGDLRVQLIDRADPSEYANLSFPKLKEITGYLFLFRVKSLQSLSQLFPNLMVIRGFKLFANYALVIYEMLELQEVALPSLTHILRGAVRIEKNPQLCYVDTINWTMIAPFVPEKAHFLVDNGKSDECPNTCPEGCPLGKNRCWSKTACQKQSAKCDDNCLGGCFNDTNQGCYVCKSVTYHRKCITTCPHNTFKYHDRRCLTDVECTAVRKPSSDRYFKPFDGICHTECPRNYMEDPQNKSNCIPCGNRTCRKECDGRSVRSIGDVEALKDCTVIRDSLEIQLSDGQVVVKELEKYLSSIEEINGTLKVIRSYPLKSLNFLRNLKKIGGYNSQSTDGYALYVVDNRNLEELWDWNTHKELKIANGKLFFHLNPKLCIDKIRKLEKIAHLNTSDEKDVSLTSNGDRIACNVTKLSLTVTNVAHNNAIIVFTNFLKVMANDIDPRSLLGYLVFYKEAPERNVTIFDDYDACATKFWKVIDVELVMRNEALVYSLVPDLKPYTQYAMYVKTYTIASERLGGQSDIIYFKTGVSVPSIPVNVVVVSVSSERLLISWEPPRNPNGNITHYEVILEPEEYNQGFIYSKPYCLRHGAKPDVQSPDPSKYVTKKPYEYSTVDPTTMVNGKNCCVCETVNPISTEKEETHQSRIDFENEVHKVAYVKKPKPAEEGLRGSNFSRERREASDMKAAHLNYWSRPVSKRQASGNNDSSTSGVNATAQNGNGADTTSRNVENVSPTYFAHRPEIVIPNLKHYSKYTVKVAACFDDPQNKNKTCGIPAIITVRTKAALDMDDINDTTVVIIQNKTDNAILVKWEAPSNPNGLVLQFHIEARRVDAEMPLSYCIDYPAYKNQSGAVLSQLLPGNYSLRLQAVSMGGPGNWTPPIYFVIPERSSNVTPAIIGGVAAAVLLIIIMSITAIYVVKKRNESIPGVVQYASVNPEYLSAGDVYVPDEWEVPREKITLIRELGQGSFGMVYEGEVKDMDEHKPLLQCAVKTVNESASLRERIEFLNEASVMKAFSCHHVVRLIGVVSKGHPTYVIMELMSNGDLKSFLRLHRPDDNSGIFPPSIKRIRQMAIEIADGMAYLADKKYVHRDLAARNCMVANDLTVKIGDFGMTRDIYETDYYRKGGKGLLPVRWMAPESLKDGVFTSQSDVWSYGVVLWEMATLASQPYQGLSNEQVLKYVIDGGVMEKPEDCLDKLYELMKGCWHYHPRARPTFIQLIEKLLPEADPNFANVSFYYTSHDRNHGTQQDPTKSTYNEDVDGMDISPSTPLRSPLDVNVPMGLSYISDDDDHEVGMRPAAHSKPWSTRSKTQKQQSSNSNEGSKGISISSSDGSKDSKASACSANGSVINGRIGGMQWSSNRGGLEC